MVGDRPPDARLDRPQSAGGPRFRRSAPAGDATASARLTDLELSDDEVEEIRAFVAAFTDSPLRERLTPPRASRARPGSRSRSSPTARARSCAGSSTSGGEPDGTHLVVDYKTDAVPEDSTPHEYIARNYETQRLVYALAALRAGAPRVEVAYCLLERPAEPVTTTYTAQDAPELADALQDLAEGLIAPRVRGHERAAPRAVRGLPGPHGALQSPAERDAQASAGSLAGSTGPS